MSEDNNKIKKENKDLENSQNKTFPNISMPENMPILYSDFVLVYSNDAGIVLNFAQSAGPINQQNVVARIGVSREHAKKLLDVLKNQLAKSSKSI